MQECQQLTGIEWTAYVVDCDIERIGQGVTAIPRTSDEWAQCFRCIAKEVSLVMLAGAFTTARCVAFSLEAFPITTQAPFDYPKPWEWTNRDRHCLNVLTWGCIPDEGININGN